MKYPTLQELGASRQIIEAFGGYNHNLRISDGEFYEMTNLTSSDYPVLSPRPKRAVYTTTTNPQGMIAKDALFHVDNGTLYRNNEVYIEDSLMDLDKTTEKTLISMGAYLIILPDKKYVNTGLDGDYGNIEAEFTVNSGSVTFRLCKLDGSDFKNTYKNDQGEEVTTDPPISPNAPDNPNNLDYWIDTSSTPHSLKQWAETTKMWTSVATTYIKISFPNTTVDLTELFSPNDGITISGLTKETLADLEASMVAWDVGKDYFIVTGILDEVVTENPTEEKPLSFSRKMPNMDFIIESGNRLWGCRYGIALNGEVVNEIYASKLGDFKNWNCFAGISTDSYVASLGTDGQFTGAITHMGYPLFFKENCLHKVYGNFPANYQIQTTACRGVQKGCSKSLAIVNETLYYKSRSAVCAYDGSLPVEISSALGEITYDDAVAGTIGNKYYISMKDASDTYHLFVYDSYRGMWHREDNTRVAQFCNCRGELLFINYGDKQIWKTSSTSADEKTEATLSWKAVTGVMGTDDPDKKYISRLVVRLLLEVGTTVRFSVEYDSSGEWEHLFTMSGTKLRSFSIPIKPKRCDHLRLRIDGTGMAKIYSICKTIEQGSDV